ncbi:substrate-binding domain-containing protein [Hellea balneolensis]|uniref:substrate-binding domain-containing protein n=1 Tax=Hellea balneolensis TaxID=287478 RepID=UPI0004176DD7|nr:substrate-binding domain-containing protein [Hellea balneolensis]
MIMKTLILGTASAAFLMACGGGDTAAVKEKTSEAVNETAEKMTGGDIRVVGSSTVYPFSTKVAQEFKNKTGYNVVVESTGSGGGHKLFCSGADATTPDITNSSRRQKKSEFDNCVKNNVGDVVEVKIGFDGIVLANAVDAAVMNMSLKDVYMAFAKEIPTSDTDCTMQENPYTMWSEINPELPSVKIEAYGPPPTSGTRDAFVEIAMEGGAKSVACMAELLKADKKAFANNAHTLREDGKWIDAGENDNALVQTLVNTPTAVGVFGYSFLDQNADKIKGANIDGTAPEFENIAAGDYHVARSLYFYIKKSHVDMTPGLQEFALEFTSDAAVGPGGYLEEIGLVPLPDADRAAVRATVENMTPYSQ